ncbi:hypothetical protein DICPUDRAFT_76169 [Dictyostelium purpureum]|uniref:Transmembrane protein n=1 Tax=Dictyostelium purpureum TaxID=5786 RepID=F0ZCT6_DICPU|nr:uncharacterized protein DICPUDRAFT_76169 [Dictyostelium purpureum]EGC38275.1 hypothetical protein DICPUDRAFT_76169 [Dictyostelium purpureum]|eukprot:XP_003285232.1 hypothetical protein DICPUDRAFT_76169 [Dictyostelium purpureum]
MIKFKNYFSFYIFIIIIFLNSNLIYSINYNNNNSNKNDININNFNNEINYNINNNNNNNYLLFKPYNNDKNCLDKNYGGLGMIILGNKTCISNNGISITVQLQTNLQSFVLCKYSNNNCKNLIACEKLMVENQCLDAFTSAMFINSQPIPSSYTRVYVIDPINNSTYFNRSESNYGYHFKQYYTPSSSSPQTCNLNQLQFTQFITDDFYNPNQANPFLSQTFKCNNNFIPEMIIGEQSSSSSSISENIIYLNQTCKNSNNYSNQFNYEITC